MKETKKTRGLVIRFVSCINPPSYFYKLGTTETDRGTKRYLAAVAPPWCFSGADCPQWLLPANPSFCTFSLQRLLVVLPHLDLATAGRQGAGEGNSAPAPPGRVWGLGHPATESPII